MTTLGGMKHPTRFSMTKQQIRDAGANWTEHSEAGLASGFLICLHMLASLGGSQASCEAWVCI